ncbi:hypothetical protein V501_03301 [Pseudogymnoascus sp. VKM F-4519 (FW-2642)]|nr:hypothetical protein V501_03301 [Pseudogymnoascus sp. VKM F-4519 (FW-2642)]
MKISLLLSVAALVHQSTCDGPGLGYDPNTTPDCIEWHNNGFEQTCEEVRDYYNITPEMFHKWSPSVGLDCKPWEYHSYCILSQERYDEYLATASGSSKTGATATTGPSTVAPSPTARAIMGCFEEGGYYPLIDKNVSPAGGDTALTIPGCRNTCYLQSYYFAGVEDGNQCRCSEYINGELAKNQGECNITCTGDKTTFCGGKGVINVFRAEALPTTTSTPGVSSAAETVLSTTQSSGARRNRVMF